MFPFQMRALIYPSREFDRLTSLTQEIPTSIREGVGRILIQVQKDGDKALVALTRKFDRIKIKPSQIRVSSKELARAKVTRAMRDAAELTLKNVEDFARASLPKDWSRVNRHGARVGEKFDPIQRVGIYVPGGSVPLVSTVFMTVALARVAGVPEIVVCSPPPISEPMLWAFRYCGATEVYRAGGAQAIAAMAYGTNTIRSVAKVFGPGNAYVTEAKRQVFGQVGVDLIAGPSELMVIADESTRIDWAAADLLAQAEHGSGRERVFCVSTSKEVLRDIQWSLLDQSERIAGNKGLREVLQKGTWFIQVKKAADLVEVANKLAPEHLQIMTRKPRSLADKITTAGGIFLGNHTPTVLGDFVAGPSHTLPTALAGRSFSGLRVNDFLRRTSLVEYGPRQLRMAQGGIKAFSEFESLPAHGHSGAIRGE
jgi:histidinol dehydrogenase